MKAIEKMFRNSEKEGVIVHNDVVELPKMSANRRFKCRCCQKEWIETINSPQIIDDEVAENLKDYYPEPIQKCTDFYKIIEKGLNKCGVVLVDC